MDTEIPEYLYKYTSLDNLYNILINKKLKFTPPVEFNDPFDCKLYNQYELDLKGLEDFFTKLNPPFFSKKFEGPNKSHEIFLARFHFMEALQNSVNKLGVSCFSADENNLLMWAHYADNHKGVCIKFKSAELLKTFPSRIRAIKYSEAIPRIDPFKDFIGALNNVPLHKSKHWAYENEYRIINEEFGYFDFPPLAIERIMFGVRFDTESMNENRKDILRKFKNTENCNLEYRLSVQHREDFRVVESGEWRF